MPWQPDIYKHGHFISDIPTNTTFSSFKLSAKCFTENDVVRGVTRQVKIWKGDPIAKFLLQETVLTSTKVGPPLLSKQPQFLVALIPRDETLLSGSVPC